MRALLRVARHDQRSALALVKGHVVIAWASHGDEAPYHSWLMAHDTADLSEPPAAFVTTPNGGAGGIWMGANGPSADAAGNIFVSSSNRRHLRAHPRSRRGRGASAPLFFHAVDSTDSSTGKKRGPLVFE